jgi:hypothetical protein
MMKICIQSEQRGQKIKIDKDEMFWFWATILLTVQIIFLYSTIHPNSRSPWKR